MAGNIRAGVVGVGYLGRFHAQKYQALPGCKLAGVVDADAVRAAQVSAELGVPAYERLEALLPLVDVVTVAASTAAHHEVGLACLSAGKHVLMEKPLAATVAQAAELVAEAERRGVVLQVGYLERFNPAFQACLPHVERPRFIECLRISAYAGRGVDVDVVLDLMSHDLDLVQALARAPVQHVHGVGVSLVTDSTDMANVRLILADGCTVNLTASRISARAERKLRLFQTGRYFSLDLAAPSLHSYVATGRDEEAGGLPLAERSESLDKGDAILAETRAFLEAVRNGGAPVVSGRDGLRAMELAVRVMEDIAANSQP